MLFIFRMMKTSHTVLQFMTTSPPSVRTTDSLKAVHDLMTSHNLRCLPVIQNGQVHGLVNDVDLKLALTLAGQASDSTSVESIVMGDILLAPPNAPLLKVVRSMKKKKIDHVLVVEHGQLLGIFTLTDALEALDELLSAEV